MSLDKAFLTLKEYLEQRPAAHQALRYLKPGVEIGIVVGRQLHCAVFYADGQPQVEQRAAQSPDVIFHIKPETVYVISNNAGTDVGDLGLAIFKEILAGHIGVQVPGSFMNILKNGYLDILKEGGAKVMAFLAQHGLTSITKITGFVRSLMKKS